MFYLFSYSCPEKSFQTAVGGFYTSAGMSSSKTPISPGLKLLKLIPLQLFPVACPMMMWMLHNLERKLIFSGVQRHRTVRFKYCIQTYQCELFRAGSSCTPEHHLSTQLQLTARLAAGSAPLPPRLPHCPTEQQREHEGRHEQYSEQTERFNYTAAPHLFHHTLQRHAARAHAHLHKSAPI